MTKLTFDNMLEVREYYRDHKSFFNLGPTNSSMLYTQLHMFFQNSHFSPDRTSSYVELEYTPKKKFVGLSVPAINSTGLLHFHRIDLVQEPKWGDGGLEVWL